MFAGSENIHCSPSKTETHAGFHGFLKASTGIVFSLFLKVLHTYVVCTIFSEYTQLKNHPGLAAVYFEQLKYLKWK